MKMIYVMWKKDICGVTAEQGLPDLHALAYLVAYLHHSYKHNSNFNIERQFGVFVI
jgi:hypothetical protein